MTSSSGAWSHVPLVQPVPTSVDEPHTFTTPKGCVLLQASDAHASVFVVDVRAIRQHATALSGALGLDATSVDARLPAAQGEVGGASGPGVDDDCGELDDALVEATKSERKLVPISDTAVDSRSLQLAVTWLEHHIDVPPLSVVEPAPIATTLESLFGGDEWLRRFMQTACPILPPEPASSSPPASPSLGRSATWEAVDPLAIYRLALAADSLGISALRGAAATLFAHFVRTFATASLDPTACVARWRLLPSRTDAIVGDDEAQVARIGQQVEAATAVLRQSVPDRGGDGRTLADSDAACEWLSAQVSPSP